MTQIKHVLHFGLLCGFIFLGLWLVLGASSASAHDGPHGDTITFNQDGSCGGGLVQSSAEGGCTHGPDPAPPGITPAIPDAPAEFTEASFATCDGNGTSGKRVQVIYAHASDVPSRYDEYVDSFRAWAATGDQVYQRSAEQTGGSRYIRFVHDANCVISVLNITLSPSGDNDFWAMSGELYNQGFHDANRKYLVFIDRNHPDWCGQADVYHDDSPGQGNTNNITYGFSSIYNGCWDSNVTIAHELGHNFGAVQRSAPNASLWDHCVDEWDVMCYDDTSGIPLRYECEDYAQNSYLDCNKDDYFNTNPKAGSYLATHWNIANSGWLGKNDARLVLDKEKSKFNGWVAATMSGFTPGKVVTLYWADRTVLGTATVSGSGAASFSFRTPLVPLGTYTLLAKDTSGMSDTETLRVIPRVNLTVFEGNPGLGIRVYFYGYAEGDKVNINWMGSDGVTITTLGTADVAANGRGSLVVNIPWSSEVGTHLIVGDVADENRSASISFTLLQTPWTVSLDKTQSKFNGWVTATMAGFAPSSPITLLWPDETVMGTATSNGSGGATITFRTPLQPLGDYFVRARDGAGTTGVAKLRVISRIDMTATEGPPGTVVRVYYYGFAPGDVVETRWYSLDGTTYRTLNSVTIASNGRASILTTIPDDSQPGVHLVRGSVVGVNRSASMNFTETVAPWQMTLSTTSSKFNGSVTATLTGFSANKTVTLTWPDGTMLGSRTTNSSGNATITFRTPLAPYGDFTVTATDADGHVAVKTLRVIGRVNLSPHANEIGTAFRVYLYGYVPGEQVQIRWYLLNGTDWAELATVTIESNGRASILLSVPWGAGAGNHTVRGSAVSGGRSASDTFTVTGLGGAEGETTPTPTPSPSPSASPTAVVTETPIVTETAVPTETVIATETPVVTETPSVIDASPVASSPTEVPTIDPVATEAPVESATAVATESPSLTPTPYVVTGITRSTNSTEGANAVDANPDTVWTATDDGSSTVAGLVLDYGQPITIGTIRVWPGTDGVVGQGTVQVSTDGESWTTWGTISRTDVPDADGWIIIQPQGDPLPPTTGQYVRVMYEIAAGD
ncbi:MAG TPA: discoidin domain-containing protein, partial [Thermomicrobiales bacterium]|nr:discoidin domain-containing protein [Thermomicrobiales bacterium]